MYGNGETVRTKSRFCKSLLKEISFVFEGVEIAELISFWTSKVIIKPNCPTKKCTSKISFISTEVKGLECSFW